MRCYQAVKDLWIPDICDVTQSVHSIPDKEHINAYTVYPIYLCVQIDKRREKILT